MARVLEEAKAEDGDEGVAGDDDMGLLETEEEEEVGRCVSFVIEGDRAIRVYIDHRSTPNHHHQQQPAWDATVGKPPSLGGFDPFAAAAATAAAVTRGRGGSSGSIPPPPAAPQPSPIPSIPTYSAEARLSSGAGARGAAIPPPPPGTSGLWEWEEVRGWGRVGWVCGCECVFGWSPKSHQSYTNTHNTINTGGHGRARPGEYGPGR